MSVPIALRPCIALFLGSVCFASAPILFERTNCCAGEFSFQEVVKASQKLVSRQRMEFRIVQIVPKDVRDLFFIGSTTEESRKNCLDITLRLRRGISHAYLIRTPLGAAVHHWNHVKQEYRTAILFGRDVFSEPIRNGMIAWIEKRGDSVYVRVQQDPLPSLEEAQKLAEAIATKLNLAPAVLYIRSDAYYRPGGYCSPYSLPIQWKQTAPLNADEVSSVGFRCNVPGNGSKSACFATMEKALP